jgi:hypothetical protein
MVNSFNNFGYLLHTDYAFRILLIENERVRAGKIGGFTFAFFIETS